MVYFCRNPIFAFAFNLYSASDRSACLRVSWKWAFTLIRLYNSSIWLCNSFLFTLFWFGTKFGLLFKSLTLICAGLLGVFFGVGGGGDIPMTIKEYQELFNLADLSIFCKKTVFLTKMVHLLKEIVWELC